MDKNRILRLIAILCTFGMLVSVYLLYEHSKPLGTENGFCDINDRFSCSTVNSGPYSEFFGIPTAFLGFIWFMTALMMAWMVRRSYLKNADKYLFFWSVVGILFVALLIFAEIFVIGAICSLCTFVHVLVAVTLVLSYKVYHKPVGKN
jgi:uncharacterized membrane protein